MVRCLCWLALSLDARSAPVALSSVETTFHAGTDAELREAIDGVDTGLHGWSVAPHTGEPQSALFRTSEPVAPAEMNITLCFLSGRPNSYFGDFRVMASGDVQPSWQGNWLPLVPVRLNATGPELASREDGHLLAEGSAGDAVFQLAVPPPGFAVTAFRVDVYPSRTAQASGTPRLSARSDGDFLLTEFRVETSASRTTNLARGRLVRASHPVRFPAETLTDGLPGTFSHPLRAGLGASFFFELDLGTVHSIDHLSLRNRGDGALPERLSRVSLAWWEAPPDTAAPVWRGSDRADGSHPEVGAVDVVRAGDGQGKFAGRWLRISSDSPVAFSPQLAEVEVYGDLRLQLAALRADGVALAPDGPLRIPPGTHRLSAVLRADGAGVAGELPCRWRLRGYHADWQTAPAFAVESACPPPGDYLLEAQARHSDGEWNAQALSLPLQVGAHLWATPGFRALAAAAILACGAVVARQLDRRRLARGLAALQAEAALAAERARIARDMHDEVGARLSQLAILQEILARELPLPETAQESLRQLATTTRRVAAALDEVVWAVNPKNDTLPALAGYLEQCATGYLAPVEIACRLEAPCEWPALEVRAPVRHQLVLAFREALQNVLKHSGAREVALHLRLIGNEFILVLADDGRGLPDDPGGAGRDGLENMRVRLAAVGGACVARLRTGGGTEVEMRVSLAQHPSRL